MDDKKTFDALERRCPRLGGVVHFGYCRACEREQTPCFKALDCWWEQFDVSAYFRQSLSPGAFEKLAIASPPNKVGTLMDLLHQAQERLKK